MSKLLTPEMWENLKNVKSAYGYTLSNSIQTGVETPHLGVGITAGDEDCWDTHVLAGPYCMQDLYNLGAGGPGNMLCRNMAYTLSVGINERGEFTVWVGKHGHPRRVVRVELQDQRCKNGTIVHFVDRIIYPPAY